MYEVAMFSEGALVATARVRRMDEAETTAFEVVEWARPACGGRIVTAAAVKDRLTGRTVFTAERRADGVYGMRRA